MVGTFFSKPLEIRSTKLLQLRHGIYPSSIFNIDVLLISVLLHTHTHTHTHTHIYIYICMHANGSYFNIFHRFNNSTFNPFGNTILFYVDVDEMSMRIDITTSNECNQTAVWNYVVGNKICRHILYKFQSYAIILTTSITAVKLRDMLR